MSWKSWTIQALKLSTLGYVETSRSEHRAAFYSWRRECRLDVFTALLLRIIAFLDTTPFLLIVMYLSMFREI